MISRHFSGPWVTQRSITLYCIVLNQETRVHRIDSHEVTHLCLPEFRSVLWCRISKPGVDSGRSKLSSITLYCSKSGKQYSQNRLTYDSPNSVPFYGVDSGLSELSSITLNCSKSRSQCSQNRLTYSSPTSVPFYGIASVNQESTPDVRSSVWGAGRGGHKVRRAACDIKKGQFKQHRIPNLFSVQFCKPNSAGKHGEEKVGVLGSPKWLEKGRSDQKVGLVRGEKRCLLF